MSIDAETQLHDLLRVALTPGVGPLKYRELIRRFETPGAILAADRSDLLDVPRIGRQLAASLQDDRRAEVDGVLDTCRQYAIRILTESSPRYPRLLTEIPDPPPVLFVRGELAEADRAGVAIVGSRSATGYGRRMAERLARELAGCGVAVISGLARGVDAAGHRGALKSGGRTIAVLGGGVLNVYPPEHVKLAELVEASGALLSESPPFQAPRSGSFPRRNRLISGMSLGVVVVEASMRSGALISARLAAEQGREVFAVPGRIDTATAAGCNRLIKDGAKLVESIDDILEELAPLAEAARADQPAPRTKHEQPPAPSAPLTEIEQQVLAQTGDEPTCIDDVIAGTQLSAPKVLAAVSSLEMHKLVRRISGAMIARR